jgi:glycosyltransferase involved in cell wall biosynthesis
MTRTLRIAQVAPPLESVPPPGYGGTERVIAALVTELVRRGHEVTTFASGDSVVDGRHIPTVERALRPAGYLGDPAPWFYTTIRTVLEHAHEFDLIHSHLEWASPVLALASPVPVVSTFHGRLDLPYAEELLTGMPGLIAISRSQASTHPAAPWIGVVHNGLALEESPFERERNGALVFVGRIAPEKGILDAIAVARLTGRPLHIIAKRPVASVEVEYFEGEFLPALRAAGDLVEDLGELSGAERDRVVARSHALLMPGTWPEPFGLAAIEALACGTPVLTRRVGALPEIVRDGVDGFFGDDVDHLAFLVDRVDRLDRAGIRASVLERFSAGRMTGDYEALYRRTLARAAVEAADRALSGPGSAPPPVAVGPGRPDPTAVPSAAVPPVAADAPAEFVIPPTHRALDDAAPPSRDAAGDRSARIETLDGAGSS